MRSADGQPTSPRQPPKPNRQPCVVGGCAQLRRGATSRGRILAAVARFRWPGDSGQRRLHGSGNWGTDLQAGAQYKYGLLWVVGMASLMAIFMASDVARLGVVTGKRPRAVLPRLVSPVDALPNWLMSEVCHRRL